MQSVSFSFGNLFEHISYIIKYELLNNTDINDNVQVTINYMGEELKEVSIKGITDNIFTESNYSSIDHYHREDLNEYFNGLLILHLKEDKDLDSPVYYFLNDNYEFKKDEDVVDRIYSKFSDVQINDLDSISLFRFNRQIIYLVNTSERISSVIESYDDIYSYFDKCLEEKEFISYNDYVEDVYHYNMKYSDKALFILQQEKIDVSENEYLAIKLYNAMCDEENNHYFHWDTKMKSNSALILNQARTVIVNSK
jgi:hypothetical protein